MQRKELKDHLSEGKVLCLWLPSLSRTLALNFEQTPTVFSGSVWKELFFPALWGQRRAAQYVCVMKTYSLSFVNFSMTCCLFMG